jgi:uncharacterized membrane protein HdeD (DUF308 family)
MTNSRRIAALIGPTAMALGATETLNLHIWEHVSAPVIYLDGSLLLVAGLSIVRAHNVWKRHWPVLVTLTGWIGIVGGLLRMVFPDAKQAPDSPLTYAMFGFIFVMGAYLAFEGWIRKDRPGAA